MKKNLYGILFLLLAGMSQQSMAMRSVEAAPKTTAKAETSAEGPTTSSKNSRKQPSRQETAFKNRLTYEESLKREITASSNNLENPTNTPAPTQAQQAKSLGTRLAESVGYKTQAKDGWTFNGTANKVYESLPDVTARGKKMNVKLDNPGAKQEFIDQYINNETQSAKAKSNLDGSTTYELANKNRYTITSNGNVYFTEARPENYVARKLSDAIRGTRETTVQAANYLGQGAQSLGSKAYNAFKPSTEMQVAKAVGLSKEQAKDLNLPEVKKSEENARNYEIELIGEFKGDGIFGGEAGYDFVADAAPVSHNNNAPSPSNKFKSTEKSKLHKVGQTEITL
jgi:hypothetical protein